MDRRTEQAMRNEMEELVSTLRCGKRTCTCIRCTAAGVIQRLCDERRGLAHTYRNQISTNRNLLVQCDSLARQLRETLERLRPTHYWSEDANCMEYAIEWGDFSLLEDSVALKPGAHEDFEITPLIVLPRRTVRIRCMSDGEYESYITP